MANTITDTSRVDQLLVVYLARQLIERLVPDAQFYKYAKKSPLPKNAGAKTMRFNQWTPFAAASAALTEGTEPDAAGLTGRSKECTIGEYGRKIRTSSLLDDTALSSNLEDALDNIANSAQETLEEVTMLGIFKNALASNLGTKILSANMSSPVSAFCAITGTNTNKQFQFPAVIAGSCARLSAIDAAAPSVSSRLSLVSIRKTVTALRRQNAKPQSSGNYIGIVHPNAMAVLQRDRDWVEWNQPQMVRETMMKGFVGSAGGVDFVTTTKAPRYAVTAHSVNVSFIFGPGAYGAVSLDGDEAVKMYIVRPNQFDGSNVLQQYGQLGWKLRAVGVALNPSAGRVLLSAEKL